MVLEVTTLFQQRSCSNQYFFLCIVGSSVVHCVAVIIFSERPFCILYHVLNNSKLTKAISRLTVVKLYNLCLFTKGVLKPRF